MYTELLDEATILLRELEGRPATADPGAALTGSVGESLDFSRHSNLRLSLISDTLRALCVLCVKIPIRPFARLPTEAGRMLYPLIFRDF